MIISLIAAMTENKVIGRAGDMPWKLSADLKNFKKLTEGHHVLMGRKTFESMGGKPLKNRKNLIVSRQARMAPPGCFLFKTIDQAMDFARKNDEKELFVIGGQQIYEETLNYADRIYLTKIHTSLEGDTFFPDFHPELWDERVSHVQMADEKNDYPFTVKVLNRKKT